MTLPCNTDCEEKSEMPHTLSKRSKLEFSNDYVSRECRVLCKRVTHDVSILRCCRCTPDLMIFQPRILPLVNIWRLTSADSSNRYMPSLIDQILP